MSKRNAVLTLEYRDAPLGKCQVILTDDANDEVLVDRIYKNRNSAEASVRARLRTMGLGTAQITRIYPGDQVEPTEAEGAPAEPEAAPIDGRSLAPKVTLEPLAIGPGVSTASDLLIQLREAARAALAGVVSLRQQADALEVDYKRLAAAADVLEGPEA